jgi:endonuclease/exonuclease/phosphatase family metal-dependent hydrolase
MITRHSPLSSTLLPAHTGLGTLRVATYNIHKGVRGLGLRKRLEIHNLGLAVEALDADIVFLQEVRLFHTRDARRFDRTHLGWPQQGQADYLAPEGYEAAYRTNAVTRHGEHGNALLARWPLGDIGHHDVSDHRFEQRGLLHVPVLWNGCTVHAVVVHLGLVHGSRLRQVHQLARFIDRVVPPHELLVVAGDFNDWSERLDPPMAELGLQRARAAGAPRMATFPSLAPVFALDRFYLRGLQCRSTLSPRGLSWARMSDHLPLVAELEPA